MYVFIESAVALLISFIINVFVVSVFAHGLSGKTNADIRQICLDSGKPESELDGFFDVSLISLSLYLFDSSSAALSDRGPVGE